MAGDHLPSSFLRQTCRQAESNEKLYVDVIQSPFATHENSDYARMRGRSTKDDGGLDAVARSVPAGSATADHDHHRDRGQSAASVSSRTHIMQMRSVKKAALFGSVLAVPLFAAGALYAWINWFSHEAKLRAALEEASHSGRSGAYLTKFDFICFNLDYGSTKDDFAKLASRLGAGFSKSIDACGIRQSCCHIGSETSGVIGLVTGANIQCVEIYSFVFVGAPDRPVCIKPSQLKVVRDTFRTPTALPGRYVSGVPGETYYRIEESRQ